MKFFKCSLLAIGLTIAFTFNSSAQVCGDVDNDTKVNIIDLVATLDFISDVNPTINMTTADCDGISGITIGDAAALTDTIFRIGSLNCNPSGSYSFAPANDDTLHIVRVLDVPENENEVFLIVIGSFSEVTDAVYLPILSNGAGSSNLFSANSFYGPTNTISGGNTAAPNEHTMFAMPGSFPGWLNGTQTIGMIKYERSSPGVGSILPEAFDRATPWLIAINRNDDLYTPVIQYHDESYQNGILNVSEDALTFNAFTDSPSLDTFTVQITHGDLAVGYKLSTPTSWVQIDQPIGVTPATVTLTADATGYGALDYNGVIRVNYDGFYPQIDSVELTLSVHPPEDPYYPAGDLNCDGATNILDLHYFVNYIFRSGDPPFPCVK